MKRLLPVLLATGWLPVPRAVTTRGRPRRRLRAAVQQRLALPATTAAGGAAATTAAGGTAASTNIQKPGECGMGTGQKATGDPIKMGSIDTNVPGIDSH